MKKNKADKTTQPRRSERKGFPLFTYLFGNRNKIKMNVDILAEEQIVSPWRSAMRTFRANRLSMIALFLFVIIVLMVVVLPMLYPIELGYQEATQSNLAPNRSYLSLPDAMKDSPRQISIGPSFSAGIDKDGKIHFWGQTKRFSIPDLAKLPKKMQNKKIRELEVGYDHIVALGEDDEIYAWGNRRLGQTTVPQGVSGRDVAHIYSSYQFSVILMKDGTTRLIGNGMNIDYLDYDEPNAPLKELALSSTSAIGLTESGEIVYLGTNMGSSYANVPKGNNYVQVVGANRSFAALDKDGKVSVWGNITTRGENKMPEFKSKPVKIFAGQYHFLALLEDGSMVAWGDNTLKQTDMGKLAGGSYKDAFVGYYQNYLIDKDGKVQPFGWKGYLLGTDDFGRDVMIRLMNGGRQTITIGLVAVVISIVIGTILGGISGFFGGRVDMFLQRFGEIINSMPFLPTIIILNSLIGNNITPTQRVYLIMVLLGLLSWVQLMRLIRAQVLSLREQEFVTAARAMGIKEFSIVFRHIIPNVISIIIVSATLSFAGSLLTEASLSFLGFGVQPPQPTWGNMLLGATDSTIIANFPWRWVYPALILSVCVICINLIGTGLDDAIDPKSQER